MTRETQQRRAARERPADVPIRAVAYLRLSKAKTGDTRATAERSTEVGLETQRVGCERHVAALGGTIVATEHDVSAPAGDFVLTPTDSPLLLASAGAGITTVLPIVEHIARTQPQRTVIVAHADRRSQDHALRDTVLHLGREIDDFSSYTWYEEVDAGDTRSRQGFMDLSGILLPDDIQVFTCGPLPFMRLVRSTLLARGVPPARIRYEVFGPDLWAALAPPPESEN